MEKLLDLEDLFLDIRNGNAAVRVIGFAGLHQQADELEMGQALLFVSEALDGLLDRATDLLNESRGTI